MSGILIVIPARYKSTRLPGKPLRKIAGVEMLRRVADIAACVARHNRDCRYVAATDDDRILAFCREQGIPAVMTPATCRSGTERVWFAASAAGGEPPDLAVNLQGDNPLCPPWVIQALIDSFRIRAGDVFTPYVQLSWPEYEQLVESKKTTPFSGTTVLVDRHDYALAFSKNVLPAIRDLKEAKRRLAVSPVRRHIGLYAYTFQALKAYLDLGPSQYELDCLEGLEQMRFLENGCRVGMTPVDYRGRKAAGGVDSPEDIERVERIIAEYGEFDLS